MLVGTGILSTAFNATNNTLLQVEAREEFRGRVLSLYIFLMIGTTPLGSIFTGFIANEFDVRLALQLNGAMCLVGLVLAALFLRWSRTA